jgi:hypothetical protein
MNLWVLLIDRENLSIVLIGFRAISLRQGGPAPTRKVRKAIPDHPASAAHDQFRSELLAWDVYPEWKRICSYNDGHSIRSCSNHRGWSFFLLGR